MKVGWDVKKLGEVCDIVNGSTPLRSKKEFWNNGDIEWFTIEDIREQGRKITRTKQKVTKAALKETSLRILPPNSVLLCCTASIGEHAITEIPLATNQQFNGLVVKNKLALEPLFLFHFCATLKYVLSNLSGKTTIDFIPISRLREIAIPLPPIVEQQRIVAILDQAFEGIAKARANAEQNLQNARALFESHLQSVFTQRGEVWVNCKLSDVVEFDKTQHKPNNALPYVGMEDIESDTGNFIGRKEPRKVKSSTFHFNCSHVLYGRLRPYLNKVLLPDFEGHCSTEVFPLLPSLNLDRNFLFYWLTLNSTKEEINATCTGARMPRANMNDVLAFDFSYPSLDAQNTIVENLKALSKETQRLEALYQRKISLLDELKKSLLQQAFAGEL